MKIEGETRGIVFTLDAAYVLRKWGKRGLNKVEAALEKLGYPIDYEGVRKMDFYPIGLRLISLLAVQKTFDLDEEEIEKMGKAAPKTSLIIRLFMKYFPSIPLVAAQIPKMWTKHYTRGSLEAVKVDEEGREIILQLKDCDLHPLFCRYLTGYFHTVARMVVKSDTVSVQETKCTFRGDKYHQYLLTW